MRASRMPASAENVRDALGKGVRYVYTHLPRLIAGSARDYLKSARG